LAAYTKDEALAFVNAIRLTLGDKVGFKWLVEKLSDLAAYIESLAEENERLNAYLEWAGAREDYESYRAAHGEAAAPESVPEGL
jgi:hypothetical protein